MKRFGSIFPFLEAGRQPRHIGRLVANHDFARAVVKYGSFDEFVFSNPSVTNLAMFAEAARDWGLSEERLRRLRFVSYVGLPPLLASQPFHVFHLGGWGWFMAGLHYIRARYARFAWPITAVTHSLNGRDVVDHAVRLSHARMAPYDAIFCTSRDGRDAMRKLLAGGAAIAGRSFAGRLEQLPLGIDDEVLDVARDRARGRRRLKIADDAVVLLVLGRITPCQKMDLGPLLRAFRHRILPQAPCPVVLLLAGSATPSDLKLVKTTVDALGIQASVRVHPNFPDEDKHDVLAAADILVSPVDNAQETFGLSLLEGAAAGLPVIASRYDGYKDIVEDGLDGFLVDTVAAGEDPLDEWFDLMDPNLSQLFQSQSVAVDLEQLSERVLRLVADAGLRAAMGRAGRAKVEHRYRWSRVIARYEECWDRLAHEAGATGIVKPTDSRNPYNLTSASLFSHYATRVLGDDERVATSSEPFDVLPYNEVREVLRVEDLDAMRQGAHEPTSLGRLRERLESKEASGFAAAWLLKYGYLRRVAERRAC